MDQIVTVPTMSKRLWQQVFDDGVRGRFHQIRPLKSIHSDRRCRATGRQWNVAMYTSTAVLLVVRPSLSQVRQVWNSLRDPALCSDRFRQFLKTNLFRCYHWVGLRTVQHSSLVMLHSILGSKVDKCFAKFSQCSSSWISPKVFLSDARFFI